MSRVLDSQSEDLSLTMQKVHINIENQEAYEWSDTTNSTGNDVGFCMTYLMQWTTILLRGHFIICLVDCLVYKSAPKYIIL